MVMAPQRLSGGEEAEKESGRKIRVGVIGCGSVSNVHLPHLSNCPHIELVSTCDRIPERAEIQAQRFKVPNHFPHIDQMLAGPRFELLVDLTDMPEHEQQGASHIAECLVTGREPLITAEHALHVVEIIIAARTSQATGRRIDLVSRFKWPVIT